MMNGSMYLVSGTLSVPKTETEQHIFNHLLREHIEPTNHCLGLDFTKSRHHPCAHAAKEASMQSCFDMVSVS